MARQIPWRKTLGARLGLLSVAILVSAILLIAADFRMLGEIDAAMAQTNVLGHDRSDAYQLLALTERLAQPETAWGRAYLRGVSPDGVIVLSGEALLNDPRLTIDAGQDSRHAP